MTRPTKKTPADEARREVADVAAQVAELERLTTAELATRYAEVFGEQTRSRNKAYLKKKLAWRIQELAEGGLFVRARARIDEMADAAPVRHRQRRAVEATPAATPAEPAPEMRDPRLPPVGEALVKTHKGVDHEVRMLEVGFEYRGERYPSLSKIAKVITGTTWNGFLFFGLTPRKPAPREAR